MKHTFCVKLAFCVPYFLVHAHNIGLPPRSIQHTHGRRPFDGTLEWETRHIDFPSSRLERTASARIVYHFCAHRLADSDSSSCSRHSTKRSQSHAWLIYHRHNMCPAAQRVIVLSADTYYSLVISTKAAVASFVSKKLRTLSAFLRIRGSGECEFFGPSE
jgi:hypothetical protein